MRRIICLSAFVLLITVGLFAQNVSQTVRGIVTEAFTGNPIEGATIIIPDSKPLVGCKTDAKGEFELKNIKPGRWSFSASIVGYSAQVVGDLFLFQPLHVHFLVLFSLCQAYYICDPGHL